MNFLIDLFEANKLRLFLVISLSLLLLFVPAFILLNRYRSAFEADQACHSLNKRAYANDDRYGCDHDLETRQWILYEISNDLEPAKVIKRFYY